MRHASLVCYISGHGFGHAVRVCEVLRAVWRRRPDLSVQVRSPAPAWLFEDELPGTFVHIERRLDVGVVQSDSLSVDPEATLHACIELFRSHDELVATEAAELERTGARLILADIPPPAFDIARRLGIPGIGLTNFSWDWIYADYARDRPGFAPVVDRLRRSYGAASLLLRLPFHGDLGVFPLVRDIPLVARHATVPATTVRRRLGLPDHGRIALLSFGGFGLSLDNAPDESSGTTWVVTAAREAGDATPPSCRFVGRSELRAAGLRYEDLVAASDAVVTKPGYGIVADCIANRTAMVYTARGRFAEYEILEAAVTEHLPSAFISEDDLRSGNWHRAVDRALQRPFADGLPPTNGAEVAADTILEMLDAATR